jgi:ketosteroid isomerase-like protein
MSEENVEIVRRAFEASRRPDQREGDDPEAIFEFLDPTIVWEVRPDFPDAETYTGYEGMRRLFATFREALDETWYRPLEFIDGGDQIVVPIRWGGRGRGSGIEIAESEEFWVFTLRDGKIVHVKEYADRNPALEAAGLSE